MQRLPQLADGSIYFRAVSAAVLACLEHEASDHWQLAQTVAEYEKHHLDRGLLAALLPGQLSNHCRHQKACSPALRHHIQQIVASGIFISMVYTL